MKRAALVLILVFVGFLLYSTTKAPSHERQWEMISARTPDATVTQGSISLHNVRNWNHTATTTISQAWLETVTIAPQDVVRVWFGFSGFSKYKALGHTFLSFELENGEVYTLSVEARREEGEVYSAFKGLFNTYDLLYGWGTERDYVGVRVLLLQQPIELYPLQLTKEEAGAVFIAVAEETHRVAEKPRFYNTITSNCTNELAHAINTRYPGRMRYHIAQNLPGLSVGYLQKKGLIAPGERKIIPNDDPAIIAAMQESPAAFSQAIRAHVAP